LENELILTSHIEGKYVQQTKKLVTKISTTNPGRTEAYYEIGPPREVYTIPFTKTAVDKLLEG
jgi:hypothetical protein